MDNNKVELCIKNEMHFDYIQQYLILLNKHFPHFVSYHEMFDLLMHPPPPLDQG